MSIATLIGDNGILNHAREASYQTTTQNIKELIEMEIIGSTNEKLELNIESLKLNLKQKLNLIDEDISDNLGKLPITIKKDNNYYKINNNKQVIINPLASIITEKNYGEYVKYNNFGKWRIFYNDGDNIFIIMDDYASSENLLNTNLNTERSCIISWPSTSDFLYTSLQDTNINVAKKYLYNYRLEKSSNLLSAKAICYLMDTENWKDFVDYNYAENAVGGPTIEMFIKSWNSVKNNKLYYKIGNNGYYVSNINNGETYLIDLSSLTEISENDLYFNRSAPYDSCWGYWLCAPSQSSIVNLMYVSCDKKINIQEVTQNRFKWYGVRPVVCLKENITGIYDTVENKWNLSN